MRRTRGREGERERWRRAGGWTTISLGHGRAAAAHCLAQRSEKTIQSMAMGSGRPSRRWLRRLQLRFGGGDHRCVKLAADADVDERQEAASGTAAASVGRSSDIIISAVLRSRHDPSRRNSTSARSTQHSTLRGMVK